MSLFGLFEQRSSLENPDTDLSAAELMSVFGGGATDSGVPVSERSALTMAAVWRSVALISGVSAALPLVPYVRGTKQPAASPLLADPHPDMVPYELWRLTYAHRLLWGNAFVQKLRNGAGQIKELWPITPDKVRVYAYRPTEANPSGKIFWVDTGTRDEPGPVIPLTSRDILHLPGLGYDGVVGLSVVQMARQTIGLGLAAERYGARFFGSGNLMGGILQTDARLEPGQAEALKERWKAKMSGLDRSHEIAVLDSGAKFQTLTMPHDDAQFLESRNFEVEEIARWFGVPPFLLMLTERSTSWGTGLEQQALGWVTFDLHPQWLAPTEQRITKEILLNPKIEARYRVNELLRGDSAARAEFYRALRELGALNGDEIRDAEDLPPVPDGKGQTYWQPTNMMPIGEEPPPAADPQGA
ncbi:phage portal protein [Actinomadura sp. DC4]|uniref:phage portal protein n=1 Tax=Actinomadura sp. DC4 TaxID=3055069 RepID=UPI0025B1ABE2|nr:phage portal protein [Actinomadura sp. DC4]MDN3356073.1 phage portal protein [Actinomadura sp. DC4]